LLKRGDKLKKGFERGVCRKHVVLKATCKKSGDLRKFTEQ
jgi:hypothetical protein